MENQPTGNVAFLFTDIVGSTRLAQEYPELYTELYRKHDVILQKIFESHNGFIFKKIGDAFCVSFHNVQEAVKAAYEVQKTLSSEESEVKDMKIRIGIHYGEAEYHNHDYIGYITLSRVNRIMSIANGGQILLTHEVYKEIADIPPVGISFRDLGERKLKDIIHPEHIYQVAAEELQYDFPPLKSLDIRPNNLPHQITKFIGREKEITQIKQLLETTRMLTIFGAGGTGKTRLALRAASDLIDNFENGVWLVELSVLNDPEMIEKEILHTLNLKEEGDKETTETLKEYLKDKQIMLIFDNSEHLIDKCASLAHSFLQASPRLKLISTSRESFNISGESIYRVPPMSVPQSSKVLTPETLMEYESAKLFNDRATAIKTDFKVTDENVNALAELCRKLDGIPFAIELAATRVNVLPVEKILERLTDRFKLLSRGSSTALPRHQTLRALIDWSYDMLNGNEKLLLQRLSIFRGGWSFEAAEEICSDEHIDEFEIIDLLTSLESKSLINVNEVNRDNRYNMLETIKEYSSEKFTDKLSVQKKYLEFFLKMSDLQKARSNGIEQINWVRSMDLEADNLRTSIEFAFDNDTEGAFKIIPLLGEFWLIKAYFKEGYQACLKALAFQSVDNKKLRADVLLTASQICYGLGDFPQLEKFANESLSLYREIIDKEGIAASLIELGNVKYTNLEFENSKIYYNEALEISNEIGSKKLKAKILCNLSFLVDMESADSPALKMKEEALKIYREIKDTHNVAFVLAILGIFEQQNQNFERASIFSEESLSISRENGDMYFVSINLINLARIYSWKKDFTKAEYSLGESLKIIRECGYSLNLHPALINLAEVLKSKGDFERSVAIYKTFLEGSSKSGGNFFLKRAFLGLAECYMNMENYKQGVYYLSFAEATAETSQVKLSKADIDFIELHKKDLKEKLGEILFEEYWIEGKTLTIDKAVSISSK